VFSGAQQQPYEIDDETGPLSVYGRTKLAGELIVLAAIPARPRGPRTRRCPHGDPPKRA
jgi:dTDP-4-dehydrorhamnose reductase